MRAKVAGILRRSAPVILAAGAAALATAAGSEPYTTLAAAGLVLFLGAALACRPQEHGDYRLEAGWVNLTLVLWGVLISHRAFIPRSASVTVTHIAFNSLTIRAEIGATLFVFIGTLFVFVHALPILSRQRLSGAEKCLLFYAGLAAVSVAWTPNRTYAAFWLLRLVSAILLPMLYLTLVGFRQYRTFILATFVAVTPHLALLYGALVTEHSSLLHRDARARVLWLGPGIASILASAVAFTSGLMAAGAGKKKRRLAALLGIFTLFSVGSGWLAGGKTGAAAFLAGPISLWLLGLQLRVRISRVLVLGIGIWVVVSQLYERVPLGLIQHWHAYQELGEFVTLHARVDLWHGVLRSSIQGPWTVLVGSGFTAARTSGVESASHAWGSTHAHNSMLNALFELGLLGAGALGGAIVATFRKVAQRKPQAGALGLTPLVGGLAILVVSSGFDSVFGGLLYGPGYLLFAFIVVLNRVLTQSATQLRLVSRRGRSGSSTSLRGAPWRPEPHRPMRAATTPV